MPKMVKTTAQQARDIAYQTTKHIMEARGGQITDVWNENPTIWWENIFSKASLTNDYFQTLVDTIIDQKIRSTEFTNPLAQYKSGEMPLGFGSTEIYFNPQKGRYFAINPETTKGGDVFYPGYSYGDGVVTNGEGLNASFSTMTTVKDGVGEVNASVNRNEHILLDKLPDIKQIFFRVNYGRQYQRTYSAIELNKVSATWEAHAGFIDGIVRDIDASVQIDEYDAMRGLFATGVEKGLIPIYPLTGLLMKQMQKHSSSTQDSSILISSSLLNSSADGMLQTLVILLRHGVLTKVSLSCSPHRLHQ